MATADVSTTEQPMRYAVESWDPAYGTSGDDQALAELDESVDATVECALTEWNPITPPAGAQLPPVTFVDGVRRIDARVWISGSDPSDPNDEISYPGVCATVAAGAVRCESGSAQVIEAVVERALYTAAPNAGPISTRHGAYSLRPLAEGTPEALYLGVHNHMTAVETALSVDLNGGALIVFDGPLRGRDAASGVGYIKTHNVQYLERPQHRVVGQLAAGQRTPLFLIGGRFTRWSWYLRLPGPVSHALSGVVRLELPGLGTVEDAAMRADIVSQLLPRYASEPHKDTRAPQNLHPIAGLERELRRRLGDPQLLERALRRAAA